MQKFLQSEIGAVLLWVMCSLIGAGVIAPFLYQAGKALAEMPDLPECWHGLAAACERSQFQRYFDRSLMLAGVMLLPVLGLRLRTLRETRQGEEATVMQVLSWKRAWFWVLCGMILAAGLIGLMVWFLQLVGVYEWRETLPSMGKLVRRVLLPAVAASVIEEWLFRGILLGLWLRYSRAWVACTGSAAVYAWMHFLKPTSAIDDFDPTHYFAGLEWLGKTLVSVFQPSFLLTDGLGLFAAGCILAWVRYRTRSLTFAMGLHAGWILAFKGFHLVVEDGASHGLSAWVLGSNPRLGLLPLVVLGITALGCHGLMKRFDVANPA